MLRRRPHTSTRTSVDWVEYRRDRRYPVPPLIVRTRDREFRTANWSLSGIQIPAYELGFSVADGMSGTLHMAETDKSFAFSAVVVWTDAEQGAIGARFTDLPLHAVETLDRYILQRFKRSPRR